MNSEPGPFLDTNVLIYALTESGPKSDRALSAIEAGGVISAQVLNETAHVLRRKQRLEWDLIEDILALARRLLRVAPLTEAAHVRAIRVARDTGYSVWDSSIVATALEVGCTTLISEDMQHGRRIDALTISNPFLS